MTITSDLDDAMSAVVVSLREPGDLADTLRRITRAAQDMVPGVDYASISIWRSGGTLETVAATDSLVDVVDALQYQLREGPCYDAVIAERFTGSGDLRSDFRWPTFGPRVAELGLVSQLAIRLQDDSAMRVGLEPCTHAAPGCLRRDPLHARWRASSRAMPRSPLAMRARSTRSRLRSPPGR